MCRWEFQTVSSAVQGKADWAYCWQVFSNCTTSKPNRLPSRSMQLSSQHLPGLVYGVTGMRFLSKTWRSKFPPCRKPPKSQQHEFSFNCSSHMVVLKRANNKMWCRYALDILDIRSTIAIGHLEKTIKINWNWWSIAIIKNGMAKSGTQPSFHYHNWSPTYFHPINVHLKFSGQLW